MTLVACGDDSATAPLRPPAGVRPRRPQRVRPRTAAGGAATTAAGEQATGEPIVVGIYTPADNPSFTAPELIDGAEAAVEYVNNQLGGIGGRPIQLESCTTDYTAPRLTACANELFQKEPLIIIPGPDAGALTVQPTFDTTGIPLIGGTSFTPPEYTSREPGAVQRMVGVPVPGDGALRHLPAARDEHGCAGVRPAVQRLHQGALHGCAREGGRHPGAGDGDGSRGHR